MLGLALKDRHADVSSESRKCARVLDDAPKQVLAAELTHIAIADDLGEWAANAELGEDVRAEMLLPKWAGAKEQVGIAAEAWAGLRLPAPVKAWRTNVRLNPSKGARSAGPRG